MIVSAIEIRAQGLRRLVGNTPLLAIAYRWRGKPRTIYAKCEQLKLTGSIKDRMALIPHVVRLEALDSVVAVHDGDAILMAHKLAHELGLGVGISSGANVVGAIELQNRMGDDAVVVTVLPDSNKRYLSTDLLREELVRDHYLSPETELTGFNALPRVCSGCIDYRPERSGFTNARHWH